MPLEFTAIDFETANASSASACSVGLARVRDGRVVETAGWLIRPPAGHDRFFEINVGIHGIEEHHVATAKTWSEQLQDLVAFAGDDVLVAHNAGFDMAVLRRACEATGDPCPPYRYACSVQVARRTYQLPSYRLPIAAAAAGFTDLVHHEATSDAVASAHIMIDAARRWDATSILDLATLSGVRIGEIAPAELAVTAAA
ncbi:DNA polymerase III subunit epsilon [Microbacterium caowuchunii]|uniref:exonuclease domain-containing protein n=1 Tax=Microbacterium caowuchunii TaxID=2614638 RepID=UPI0012472130|nr:exonuclease domain-containing protein [Microbacterium caowuchunii]QEV99573.1 DNA polymerase III subunit epsilon [Microbacterium caowuchunii]